MESGFSNELYSMLVQLFNALFTPSLTEILTIFWEFIVALLAVSFSYICYLLLIWLLGILDSMEGIVGMFAGVENVIVDNRPMTFLEMLFQTDVVSRAFLLITVAAVGICFIFTIISTVRSMSSMTLENKNPISQVLKDALKACVSFMLVPFLCIALLQMSSVVTKQIQTAVKVYSDDGTSRSMGLYIFLTSSLRAGRMATDDVFVAAAGDEDVLTLKDSYGITLMNVDYLEPSMDDELRRDYLEGRRDYLNIMHSGTDFSVARIDYPLGFVTSIFMIILLAGVIIQFIRRMLELAMLYIVSPFFVAAIPLDRGEMFKRWREMFIAKFLSGFGVIFALKIFMLMLPLIFSQDLNLGRGVIQELVNKVQNEAGMESGDINTGIGVPDIPAIPGTGNSGTGTLPEQGGTAGSTDEVKDSLIRAMDYMAEQKGMPSIKDNGTYEWAMYNLGLKGSDDPLFLESFLDSCLKIIFFLGGMFAVYKSSTMFLEILNPKVAEDAKASTMLAMAATLKAANTAKKAAVLGAEVGFAVGSGFVTAGAGTAATAGAVGAKTAATVGAKTAVTAAKTAGKAAQAVGSVAQNTAKNAAKTAAKTAAGTIKQGAEEAASGISDAIKGSGDKEG